ncbi:UNVERIFIED_CONTAM: hypothetical protein GTU68_043297 [Idotea baltica]|nr:hypothetical protein [Idotea baltica]
MMKQDKFSQLLGMKISKTGLGVCHVELMVREDMVNGFGIAHGGITYSLADSAFAFACNSYGEVAVSIETSISHIARVSVGDVLLAKARMISRSRKLGIYEVEVYNKAKVLVAFFKGTCYHTGKFHN